MADVREMLRELSWMEYGDARVARAEEAVREADVQRDGRLGFDARMALIKAAVFGGQPEKALVAFTWCLAKHRAEPEAFPAQDPFGTDLLWVFKWITLEAPWYPQFSLAQINGMLDDMEASYRAHNLSLRPVHMQRCRAGVETGDLERAFAEHAKFMRAKRDTYADCRACEVNFDVEMAVVRGEGERALEIAEPLLSGELSCAEIPHETYPQVLQAAQLLGRAGDERRFREQGYALARENRDFVAAIALYIRSMVRAGEIEAAAEIARRHMSWADEVRVLRRKMDYYAAASVALRTSEPARADSLAQEARSLAARFDARNGNSAVSDRLFELI